MKLHVTTFALLSKLQGHRNRQTPGNSLINELHCRMSIVLIRQNAQTLLAHIVLPAITHEFLVLLLIALLYAHSFFHSFIQSFCGRAVPYVYMYIISV